MDSSSKAIGKDIAGYEVLTDAMRYFLNQFPGLLPNERVKFEELGNESGIAFSADNGALVYSERKDVIGCVHQTCKYPFYIVYRMSSMKERQKISVHQFLDALGKWICKETAVVDGVEYQLASYPVLAQGRKIKRIVRDNSYGLEPQENGVQDWILPITVEYTNDFKM